MGDAACIVLQGSMVRSWLRLHQDSLFGNQRKAPSVLHLLPFKSENCQGWPLLATSDLPGWLNVPTGCNGGC